MAKLINGNGNPAIYAGEDADLIASLAGNVTCIANVGNKYATTEEDANTIGLADGVIITKEGRRIQLDAGETDLFTIPTGSSGVTNYYIIGYKLVQNDDSTQVAEKFVQKMSSSSETITENTFRGGATEVYISLYRVTQVGFDITAVDGLLPSFLDNAAIKDDISQIDTEIAGIQYALNYFIDNGNTGTVNLAAGTTTNIATISLPTADIPRIGFISVQFNIAMLENHIYLTVKQGSNYRSNFLNIPSNLYLAPGTSIVLPISIRTDSSEPVIIRAWSEVASAADCVWEYIA